MNWYKIANNGDIDWWFIEDKDEKEKARQKYMEKFKEQESHKIIHSPQQRKITLMLYRGFNYLPKPNQNGSYTLSPDNSEQNTLWFTHKFINHYNPIEYAKEHGKYFLKYPLEVTKHYQTVTYDNNDEKREVIPNDIEDKINITENCRYYRYIELPEGWFFSYKTEKFIVCTIPLIITPDMIN